MSAWGLQACRENLSQHGKRLYNTPMSFKRQPIIYTYTHRGKDVLQNEQTASEALYNYIGPLHLIPI